MDIIRLKSVVKKYGDNDNIQTVLNNIDLNIEKGSMTSIMGPSGSGKSSLLNIIGLLDGNYSGEYFLEGEEVSNMSNDRTAKIRNEKIGFVFQDFNLIKELTAKENVKMNLLFSNMHKKGKDKISKKDMQLKSEKLLKKVGLEEHMDKTPGQLSGGQKQRVAIARAMVNEPEIILADEPTGALDSRTGQEIMEILKELNKSGKTIIIVTHDVRVSKQCSSRIEIRDGEIVK